MGPRGWAGATGVAGPTGSTGATGPVGPDGTSLLWEYNDCLGPGGWCGLLFPYLDPGNQSFALGSTATSSAEIYFSPVIGETNKIDLDNTTTDVFNILADTLTTADALEISVDALSSGNGLSITSSSTALTTGGNLLAIEWTGATTSTADLVNINIGSSSNANSLLNITDNSSTVFKVTESQIESAVPHVFSASGDVSIAYDLVFTNQTAAGIQSYGPLSIEAGESFENNDLTLLTYGTGSINLDAGSGSTVQIGSGGAGTTTPDIFALDVKSTTGDPSGAEGYMYYNTADNKFRCYQNAAWTDCGSAGTTSKTLKLSPEFDGATFTASASTNITGSMTADSVRDGTEGWLNYYEWTSNASTSVLHEYTLVVKISLPSDFSSWATSNAIQILYVTDDEANTNNKFDLTIYNEDDSPATPVFQILAQKSGTDDTWATLTVDDSGVVDGTGNEWDAANETALFFFKMYSLDSNTPCSTDGCYVRIGDIILSYTGTQ